MEVVSFGIEGQPRGLFEVPDEFTQLGLRDDHRMLIADLLKEGKGLSRLAEEGFDRARLRSPAEAVDTRRADGVDNLECEPHFPLAIDDPNGLAGEYERTAQLV